ncbi:MAG: phosphate ABC transporter substrate-binding protein [Pseudomonadota bacterium]|nr:phosphate ABC transporter substrate-binding protein [Pseudomonadota bacterium]
MRHMKLVFLLPLVLIQQAYADIAVIVHPENKSVINQDMIQNLFMGRSHHFSNGSEATPVNQQDNSSVRKEFELKALGRADYQMKQYWSKLIFTGKAVPPAILNNDQDIIEFVSEHKDAIGYINAQTSSQGVKIIKVY